MTISGSLRRDPQKGKKEFSTHKGFTVIELMIAVAVVAIIASLALPSYRTLIEKRHVTSSAQQVAAFLSSAKMEAVKHNQNVRLSSNDTADTWCLGFASYAANADPGDACDCTEIDPMALDACVIENLDNSGQQLRVLNGAALGTKVKLSGIVPDNTDDVVSIDPLRGMVTVNNVVVKWPLEVRLASGEDTYALNVRVSPTGRVTMCSDMDRTDLAVPGYDDC